MTFYRRTIGFNEVVVFVVLVLALLYTPTMLAAFPYPGPQGEAYFRL